MNPNPTPTEPSKRLTPEKLEEIRKECEAATEGPWDSELVHAGLRHLEKQDIWSYCYDLFDKPDDAKVPDREDAQFIANSRQNVPALLSHIQDVEREKERLREALERAYKQGHLDGRKHKFTPPDFAWALVKDSFLKQQETERETEKESKDGK